MTKPTLSAPLSESTADLVDRIAAAALSVGGVHSLHGGVRGEVASYLPGRRVSGIRVGDDQVHVHVAVEDGFQILDVADGVHQAVAGITTRPIHVAVEDLVTAEDVAAEREAEAAERAKAEAEAEAEAVAEVEFAQAVADAPALPPAELELLPPAEVIDDAATQLNEPVTEFKDKT